ncbi:MAG: hypothetical protein HW391_59 [Chloroflexi bacterium]|nr:hypothetical protein [Chloroflexota bacterium]
MTQALTSGSPVRRRRALMGLLDADGWTWASVKATIWFVILIFMLAYIPDRAYYFTVNRTLELGLLAWSPVNFCPAENKTLPCPAPVGAVVPWEPSPPELGLPGPRTHAAVGQFGSRLLVVGGSDGSAATTTTYIADLKKGALQPWSEGPALPEARSGASLVIVGSAAYLVGGSDVDGKPTDTVWMLPVDIDTAELGAWEAVEGLSLPEARTGASGQAVADGFVLLGGRGPDGAPTSTVWKSTTDAKGVLGQFEVQAPMIVPVADASVAQIGDFVWLYGGSSLDGPVGAVQRGTLEARPVLESICIRGLHRERRALRGGRHRRIRHPE